MLVARSRGPKAAALALLALGCALIALAMPALAAAETFTIDSTSDEGKGAAGAVCETGSPGECTLRAAIEAANFDPGADVILFDQNVFGGTAGADEIEPATALPAIKEPLQILGDELDGISRCGTLGGIPKPCQGISAPVGSAALTVESDDVTITGLSIGGGQYGIEVLGEAEFFVAEGNWIGFHLSATEDPIERDGILLTAGSDAATIGGTTAAQRNVIGFSAVGIYVEGASEAKIRGNYLGVSALGRGDSDLSTGVRIVDVEGIPVRHAEDDEVGAVLSSAEGSTAACDGGCNVIAADSRGVDLTGFSNEAGKLPATGPTRVRGNYLGLSADGTEEVADAEFGVFAAAGPSSGPGPSQVTVGGAVPTESNYIEGGDYSIYEERADGFRAEGNFVGLEPGGADSVPPTSAAVFLYGDDGLSEEAEVNGNRMRLQFDQRGVESHSAGALIADNEIIKAEIGVYATGNDEGDPNLIEGNEIVEPDTRGIRIENDENVVVGNTISNAGRAGIQLWQGADGNRIGGDLPAEENLISGSGEGAIEVEGTEDVRNEIRANRGSLNAPAFIALFGTGVGEIPNGGVEPPSLGTVDRTSAEGTAEPFATVRVFRKAAEEAGELASFLGSTAADGSGHWKLSYPAIAGEGFVAATQTKEGGTSELTAPKRLSAEPGPPPPGPEENAKPLPIVCAFSSSACGGGDTNPPATPRVKITKKPKAKSSATTAKFKFTANPAAGAKFECKLDKGKFAKCKPPKTYKKLKPGKHKFQVRAYNEYGGKSKPATYKFTVTE